MPCNFVIMEGRNIVLERWTGTVTHEELMNYKREQLRNVSIAPGASVLTDCREAVFATPAERVREISEMDGDAGNVTRIRRYAFLVNEDTYERAQLFAHQTMQHGATVIVFNSFDVACAWLGIDTAQASEIMNDLSV